MSVEHSPRFDVAVVGSGIAGLFTALTAAAHANVVVVSKGPIRASSSWLAQGGVAAAIGADDAPVLHAEDTIRAGRGLSRPSAVRVLTRDAPTRISDLRRLGVEFDAGIGLEGGHSRRRILHAGGASTGERILRILSDRIASHPRISVSAGEHVISLWRSDGRCIGVRSQGRAIAARATVLATGGMTALWEQTTNPPRTVGDGLMLAYHAGAALADLEFVQFHPTALVGSGLLLSEALRGEGALLLDASGKRFTDELAPRDIVARAIGARGTALLDLRHIDRESFGGLMKKLEHSGHDPAAQPIPVTPAAHFSMGGIVTDLDGRTELPGLYAAGECACTGVHGANRLASNSLLECLVFGRRAAMAALDEPDLARHLPQPPPPRTPTVVTDRLRHALWRDAGLVRDAAGLERLAHAPHLLVRLMAENARARMESRGAHFRSDFPRLDHGLEGHFVLRRGRPPELEHWS